MNNTISQFLDKDHNYLNKLWQDFFSALNDLEKAEQLFQKFHKHHFLHIQLEDKFLFPRLSEQLQLGENSGIIQLASADHRAIVKLHKFVAEAFVSGDKEKVISSSKNLDAALKKHREREMELHYPVSDRFIALAEWEEMIVKVYGKN